MDSFDYDIFVSHASEDKDTFVRPLVEQLEVEHLTAWYDETELRPGDRLIQSVERGLARSRFGLVVISPAFLERNWPRAELDALTNRELATGESVLLPVWLNVDANLVRKFSPLLADRVAIIGSRGVGYTASRVLEVVRPGRSPIVIAREQLQDEGVPTPPPSDVWWLDQIESAAVDQDEGGFQDAMLWGRWGFPLPPKGDDNESRGERLRQAVLRNSWIAEADRRPITQITPPEKVHEFIREMPGLERTCFEHPAFLGAYAPQLLIPGFGGDFETLFDGWLHASEEQGRGRSSTAALHSPTFCGEEPASVACTFVQGELHGPEVQFYEPLDYLFWSLSSASLWLPSYFRDTLIEGQCRWGAWEKRDGSPWVGDLLHAAVTAEREQNPIAVSEQTRRSLIASAEESAQLLDLPETGAELADRLLDSHALDAHIQRLLDSL